MAANNSPLVNTVHPISLFFLVACSTMLVVANYNVEW